MARIHRKLFPAPTTTNQTQECPDFCDPACPYNCYSFPDYSFPPPPPPPPSNQISSYLIILASLFTVIFVLVGFYVIKIKCCTDWRGRRPSGSGTSLSDDSQEFVHENQVDHPIWLITTVGLHQSIINSITVCKYRKGEGLIEGTECSVCLNEFLEDETLRLLPKCNHAFHIRCIDTWLRSHVNCPLCRAAVVSDNVNSEAAVSNSGSMEQNSNNVGRNQDAQMERNDVELVSGVSENRTGTGEAEEAQQFTGESISKERPSVDESEQVVDEIEREISSVSMDSRVDHMEDDTQRETDNLLREDGDCSTMFRSVRRSSVAQHLHISPVSMKRSVSCSARTVSARGYRNLNSSLRN